MKVSMEKNGSVYLFTKVAYLQLTVLLSVHDTQRRSKIAKNKAFESYPNAFGHEQ